MLRLCNGLIVKLCPRSVILLKIFVYDLKAEKNDYFKILVPDTQQVLP